MERIINIRQRLSDRIESHFIDNIAASILQYPEDFSELYRLIKDSESKIAWRAAWACEKISEQQPELLLGRQEELMKYAMECTHDGTKRELLSILLNLPVADPLPIPFLDFCLDRMLSTDEAIAVQALCIKLAYRIALHEPELLEEVRLYLENSESEYYSQGVKTVIRKTLKNINGYLSKQKNRTKKK